jgi:hypothetical protein
LFNGRACFFVLLTVGNLMNIIRLFLTILGLVLFSFAASTQSTDSEDGPKGFRAHSDQERILEEALHKFLRFQ